VPGAIFLVPPGRLVVAMGWSGELLLDGLIMTSDLCTCGTFVSLYFKLRQSKTAAGLSLQTLMTVVGARTLHLLSHVIGLHYIPAVLPWILYVITDVINACVGAFVLFSFVTKYYDTYEKDKDNFGIHIFQKLDLLPKTGLFSGGPLVSSMFLYSVVTVMAFGWYNVRRSHHSFITSYFCCFYEVMGAVALIPQLWLFQADKRVSPPLANFVVLTALNRLCTLSFWVLYPKIYLYRYPDNRGIQMCSEAMNILILSDFLYYWARSKLRGDKEVIIGDGLGGMV